MTDHDAAIFQAALTELALLYGKAVPAARVSAYFAQLRDLPWQAVRAALDTLGRTVKYFPSVMEIREAVKAGGLLGSEPRGSYPPDVAAQRRRYGLNVELPVKPDHDARFGHRWGVQPRPGMTYDDICREARRRGAKSGEDKD